MLPAEISLQVSKIPFTYFNAATSPSVRPTVRPSDRPSVRPTVRPTVRPSDRPSVRPSDRPTVRPSDRPSDIAITLLVHSCDYVTSSFMGLRY